MSGTFAVALAVFVGSGTLLVLAGVRLARDGDVIADGTGLGGLWVGTILVSAATSLPELTTDLSAVWQGAPGLAVGDLFGSNLANLAVLATADLLTRHTRMLTRVAVNQLAVGTLGVCLAALAALGIAVPGVRIGGLGWSSAAIAATYLTGMWSLRRNRPAPPFGADMRAGTPRPALRGALVRFAGAGAVILLAAPCLAASVTTVAEHLGLSHGFAGLVLLALVTSLPEAVVTATSVRAGSYDLAIGNLLGSNCFNMAALVVLDVADGHASLLANVESGLIVSAMAGQLLTGFAMLGVLDREERAIRPVEWRPLVMLAIYGATLVVTYRLGG
jgi:cation:H+ antiporter